MAWIGFHSISESFCRMPCSSSVWFSNPNANNTIGPRPNIFLVCTCNYIFIYHVVLASRQRKNLFGLRVKLPPVYHTRWRLHTISNAERQAGKLWIPIFMVFDLTQTGIEQASTVSVVAYALSTYSFRSQIILFDSNFLSLSDKKPAI